MTRLSRSGKVRRLALYLDLAARWCRKAERAAEALGVFEPSVWLQVEQGLQDLREAVRANG